MSEETTMIGWHFATTDETLGYEDGRKIIVGQTHSVEAPIELCTRGLHASENLLDALVYAPGPILFRVELSGQITLGHDKAVATHRQYLARLDCTSLLDQFARACALSVAHFWEPSEDVMRFLLGDESKRAAAWASAMAALAAARNAARFAARDAARFAARDAADDAMAAARFATRFAARAAARFAARDAAMAAAWDAARFAARDARDAARFAAWDAAWDAARDAAMAAADDAARDARAEQSAVLTEYVLDAMGQGEKT